MIADQYSISHISEILDAKAVLATPETVIRKLLTDSRTVIDPEGSLFFAVNAQRDGHLFIKDAYENGVRNFVIADLSYAEKFKDANFLLVKDVLQALQALAKYNRKANDLKVIGVTGSNGKTIVKEWLYQLLASDYNIIRSPKSFNSQIGVPLSVW
ncbi:MAG: bifunctional UDP-N-acetylmuramoyl-tripeptide:D-alanyl-D-alanine ligase/alanine racemase, partial [Pedobacter sp.]